MKSVKEKSEEYSFIREGTDLKGVPYKDYSNYKMEGFEAGANYVLSAIIECMPKTHSFNPNEAIDIIASRIKQLKK